MGGEYDDRNAGRGGRATRTPSSSFSATIDQLRRDPVLFVPFAVVGLLLAAIDWLRRRDPIPAVEREAGFGSNGLDITVEFVGYPTGIAQTTLPYESLVALEFPFLVWSVGLQILSLVAISVAGALTMARAMGREPDRRAVTSLFAFVVAMDLGHRLLGSIDALQAMGLFGLVPLALYLVVIVQLFPLPGLLVAGRSPRHVLARSRRRVAGRGWSILGLVLLLGLSAWLLASLPFGTVLSSLFVAPVHAVAIVAVLDRQDASA
ncbi:hypothetical protein ACFO5R_13270 [Halosolutus amylolyticus]|uniref:Sec-independent protein translocase protein TatC n=1 Tax=Halosolutus amylolyticus TaxID=2932267 RepID=A0ABD5PQS8_9EURY|nr:hypothetical protein [Halosolutus amylolyticus]